jgi:hypothetical protein
MAYCTCPGWLWCWIIWCNEDWQGKPKYSEKTCPSAALSTTNPTWPDPGSNPGRRDGKPATKRLSCGAANRQLRFRWVLTAATVPVTLIFCTIDVTNNITHFPLINLINFLLNTLKGKDGENLLNVSSDLHGDVNSASHIYLQRNTCMTGAHAQQLDREIA